MNKLVKYLTIIILLSSALAVSAQNDEKAIRKGNRQYKKANYAEAISKYKEVIELSPNNTKARFNLGDGCQAEVGCGVQYGQLPFGPKQVLRCL